MQQYNIPDQIKMGILGAMPAIVTFFTPATYIILLVVLLMIVDTMLGMRASRREGQKISSNRFSDFFAKLIGYMVFILIGLLLQLSFHWEYTVWVSALIPIYTEAVSIDENQKRLGKKGWITQAEEIFKFALKIKSKRDKLRDNSNENF